MMRDPGAYYRPADFDRTEHDLEDGREKKLESAEEAKLNQLMLANRNARLVLCAATTPIPGKLHWAKKLMEFMKKHQNVQSVTWINIIAAKLEFAASGLATAAVSGKRQ